MDMLGKKFGRLTVIALHRLDKGKYWLCQCECGGITLKRTGDLNWSIKKRRKIGCGCTRKESIKKAAEASRQVNTKHGLNHSKLHYMYDNMRKRCYRPGTNRYERYGGRGIGICDEWRNDRSEFYRWALENGWQEGMSIDRINVDGHYSPSNCRFIPIGRQSSNTSRNRFLCWRGRKQTVSDWARELGIRSSALQHRVDRGWSLDRIFTQPFRGTVQ